MKNFRTSIGPLPTRVLPAIVVLAVVGYACVAAGTPRGAERAERPVTPRGSLLPDELHLTQLFENASRSVVHITSLRLRRSFTRDVYRVPEGSGSGFVWDDSGHIVTNYHVIQNGQSFQVVLADESSWNARLVGVAPNKDLAVLKIEAPRDRLAPLALGESHDLRVGQNTYAIGNPFGLDQSLTRGVISALGREITSRMRTTIYDVIQTDTAVNPGNSGGPLLDSAGRLIGVNTAIFSPTGASAGISFAIPVDTVRRVVPDLIAYGRVKKPVIGFISYPQALPRHFPQGVLVVEVPEGSALERAGLRGTTERRLGDIITAINGRPTPSRGEFEAVLERFRAGESVTLKVVRGLSYEGEGGREIEIETKLQTAEAVEARSVRDRGEHPFERQREESRAMITQVDWRGELDGDMVLTVLDENGAEERVIDRPGDLVSLMMAEDFADDALVDVVAVYGYCLASKGISEPIFVDQIVAKIAPFIRSARIDSLTLYQLTERIAELVRSSGKKGVELRQVLLDEAHRMRGERDSA